MIAFCFVGCIENVVFKKVYSEMWVCRVTRVLQILVRMEEVSLMIRSGTFDRFIVNLIRGSLIYSGLLIKMENEC